MTLQSQERIRVVILEDYASMATALAERIASVIRDRNAQGEGAVLGLATGSTPIGVYRELIRLHREEGLDFSRVVTFNLDEYVGLKPTHDQSYRYFMNENLFDHVNVNPKATHVPDGTITDLAEVEAFCVKYEEMIADVGGN